MDLTGDSRAIYGAMIWMADKLDSEDDERARQLYARTGKAFVAERE
ncbi:conjugal transfer protein TraD [Tardiphaga sp. 172_B4_N1_3]